MKTVRLLILIGLAAGAVSPVSAAELAYPNGVDEGFSLWSSTAELNAIWQGDPPRNPWLMADSVASTYDVGTRALHAGDSERAYRLWLSLAQAGLCRAKFAVGYLLDPLSPKTLENVTAAGHSISADERATAAFAWYLSAAEEGWPAAQRHVGDAYAAGTVVPADPLAAKLWYRRAARAMDPDAMLALAAMFLQSESTDERVEGMMWALVARDDDNLFWLDDAAVEPLIHSYANILPAQKIAEAKEIARHWRSLEWLLRPSDDETRLLRRKSFKRMLVNLAPATASPAAMFDVGVMAVVEGRHQDAFDAWWPLARGGHCQAQLAVAMLGDGESGVEGRPYRYPDDELLELSDAIDTAIYHAAMQGVTHAQFRAAEIGGNPEISLPALDMAALRWDERAAMQGDVHMIRLLVQQRYPDTGSDNESPEACLRTALTYQRTGRHDQDYIAEHCRSMLNPVESAEVEVQALEWRPEVP